MPIYDCAARFLQKADFAHAVTNGDELLLGELSKMAGAPVTFSHSDNPLQENYDAVVISDLPTPDTPTDCIEQAEQIVALLSSTHAKVVIFSQEETFIPFLTDKIRIFFAICARLLCERGLQKSKSMSIQRRSPLWKQQKNSISKKNCPIPV